MPRISWKLLVSIFLIAGVSFATSTSAKAPQKARAQNKIDSCVLQQLLVLWKKDSSFQQALCREGRLVQKASLDRREQTAKIYDLIHENCVAKIWKSDISRQEKQAIQGFTKKKSHLQSGAYGQSIRELELDGKSAAQISSILNQKKCTQREDFLRKRGVGEFELDAQGKKIPMTTFICADGGVVRFKPAGDPHSRFRPQPHGSKSLMNFGVQRYEDFADEVAKVDRHGRILPKSPHSLARIFPNPQWHDDWVDGWAELAHFDLGK